MEEFELATLIIAGSTEKVLNTVGANHPPSLWCYDDLLP